MMRQISIHNNNEISRRILDPMNICRSKAQLLFSWSQNLGHPFRDSSIDDNLAVVSWTYNSFVSINCLQLLRNFQCPIRASIINNNDFKIKATKELTLENHNTTIA